MFVFIGQMANIRQEESGDLLNISFLGGEKFDILPPPPPEIKKPNIHSVLCFHAWLHPVDTIFPYSIFNIYLNK